MSLRHAGYLFLDSLLDKTVLPGYSKIGYRLRHQQWARDPAPDALRSATAMVTGANGGIGKAIAASLAMHGAHVLITVRNRERGERARDELAAAHPGAELGVEICDVADLGAVREFAADLTKRLPRLDVIVHNAGVLPARRTETVDGHELSLATHVLGPVLLTDLLTPILANSTDPRVILMSSGGAYTQALPVRDPEYRDGHYRGATAYARTKRIQVALTPIVADRWSAQGVSVYCMHPGWADTPGLAESLPAFRRLAGPLLRTPEQAADTAVWLAATEPAPPTGTFWHDRRQRPAHYLPATRENDDDRQRLWRYCMWSAGINEDGGA